MTRSLTCVFSLYLLLVSGQAPWLHVHADTDDHQDDQHRHGLASHGHGPVAPPPSDSRTHLEPHDPADQVVSITLFRATTGHAPAPVAAGAGAPVAPEPPARAAFAPPVETRGHGPPGSPASLLRAPPYLSA